jgi:YHS domain-containing protein
MPEFESTPEQPVITVCGGKIKDVENAPSAFFQGKRIYFCTPACLAVFYLDPERFIAGEIEHPED